MSHNPKIKFENLRAMVPAIVFTLVLSASLITTAIYSAKRQKNKIENLRAQIKDLKKETEEAALDSALSRGLDPVIIKWDIECTQNTIADLKQEAFTPMAQKYALGKFFTYAELNNINQDIKQRLLSTNRNYNNAWRRHIRRVINDNTLTAESSLDDLMSALDCVANTEHTAPQDSVKLPAMRPLVTRKVAESKLNFTNKKSQNLYGLFQRDYNNRDELYIYQNPKYAKELAKHLQNLCDAYEQRAEVEKIKDYFTELYQPKLDSLTYEITKAQAKQR